MDTRDDGETRSCGIVVRIFWRNRLVNRKRVAEQAFFATVKDGNIEQAKLNAELRRAGNFEWEI